MIHTELHVFDHVSLLSKLIEVCTVLISEHVQLALPSQDNKKVQCTCDANHCYVNDQQRIVFELQF